MLRRSLITFALVVSGLLITTAAGTTIQRQDLAGSRTSTREKVNTVSSSNDLLDATAAKAPASQAAAHPQWSVRTVSVTKPTSAASSSQTAASTSVASSAPASQQAVATSDSSDSNTGASTSTAEVTVSAAPSAAQTATAAQPAQQQPTQQPAQQQPTQQPAQQPATQPAQQTAQPQAQQAPAYASRVLMFAGVTVPYIIGNEGMTAAPGTGAATWGGQANYSNNSGQNTHFIGHNPGSFAAMLSLGIGSPITVTDAAGNPRTYHVYQLATVNPNAVTASGQYLWNAITGTGGGQRITLQTCVGNYWRLIAFAR
ncbi:sortase domain-containing protein [Lacticaseibacillus paracasei]|uniref:Cell surface protein n=3 Tax=Lacticaseibacillus paracasei TaxID=1597 RepID=A0A806LBG7_LACPA|nr:sortase [Lacticaseibacillus paracasei]AHJ32305.1 cell surface protein [Lacticaseibacillus paracasei N1115]